MLRIILMALMLGAMALPGAAQGLRELSTRGDGAGWQAVGLLDIGGTRFCTGALIAPDLVLTAAHCLYDRDSGAQVAPATIEFRAGWRNGRAEALRTVRRAVAHPDYVYQDPDRLARIARDVALLQLDRPIRLPGVAPFATADRSRRGAEVGVVSYARGRAQAPSLERTCHVLARDGAALMLDCSVDLGASGAPIFTMEDGSPRIVSVVSAMADAEGERVSLGAEVGAALPALMAALRAEPRSFAGTGGARFVRPGAP